MATKSAGKMVDVTVIVIEINSSNRDDKMAELRERYLRAGWEIEASHVVSSNESGYKIAYSLVKYE